jgi:hypothetical protein
MRQKSCTHALEHLQASNCDTLRSLVHATILVALVGPASSSTGVKKYTDKEKVDQTSAALCVVDISRPGG